MTSGFYCECGMFVPFGTPVKQQIRHINSQYHKQKLMKRKCMDMRDRCSACGRICSKSYYTYKLKYFMIHLHIKCEHELFKKMLEQHGYEREAMDTFKRLMRKSRNSEFAWVCKCGQGNPPLYKRCWICGRPRRRHK